MKTQKYMKTNKTSRKAGFTLVEIMIVVAIIGLLAAIAIPNFIKARATSQQNACINNLRQIDGAISEWALETGQIKRCHGRRNLDCFGLHQAERQQRCSGLPGRRHIRHDHRGCHPASDLFIEHVGRFASQTAVIVCPSWHKGSRLCLRSLFFIFPGFHMYSAGLMFCCWTLALGLLYSLPLRFATGN